METQYGLFDPPEPVPNKTVDAAARPRIAKQARAVLARLRKGPATNIELIPISTRFGARIHELKKAGYVIDVDYIDRKNGMTQYTLKKDIACE